MIVQLKLIALPIAVLETPKKYAENGFMQIQTIAA